jgi:hypothetical protein
MKALFLLETSLLVDAGKEKERRQRVHTTPSTHQMLYGCGELFKIS